MGTRRLAETTLPMGTRGTRCAVAMLLFLASGGFYSAAAQTRPVAANVRTIVTVDKPSYFLGEKVLVQYCLENTSNAPIEIVDGSAHNRFKIAMTDERGTLIPARAMSDLHELSTQPEIAPGNRWCKSFSLTQYAWIEKPGLYDLRVIYEAGWVNAEPPEGRTRVEFVAPTEADAESVVAAIESLQPKSNPRALPSDSTYRDYSGMRSAIYITPLLKRAQAGSINAVRTIGESPLSEATQALVELLNDSDPAIARQAASTLTLRLPPALDGTLGTLGGLGSDRALASASWRTDFAVQTRAAARNLLGSAETLDVRTGAFMIAAVGEPEDAPTLSAALTRAIEITRTLPLETDIYPRPRGAARELIRAAEGLIGRGYLPPAPKDTAGDVAMWLVAIGRGARPIGWESEIERALGHDEPYIREIALDRLPLPLPASLMSAILENFGSSDVDVQVAACRLAARAKLPELRADVIEVFRKTTDSFALSAAENALYALGSRSDYFDILAMRLADAPVASQVLPTLLDVFEITGGFMPDTITTEQSRALSSRWQTFINRHRAEIAGGIRLSLDDPDVPADLVPPNWSLSRPGKPAWPVR
jgi:hypothetical protein